MCKELLFAEVRKNKAMNFLLHFFVISVTVTVKCKQNRFDLLVDTEDTVSTIISIQIW